ncbi:lipopolysaccharide transport periplasmic protein LptA [Shewanella avicenniae]|uniref:Lipopolysaccharide transport periplasmic protein LptA n=1 Tax=Shewanella avicenniae TaxID=2814294 RepID=A0ABX7QTW5_9GAMM|nr:lipopolysaccharide transport periplasmic protein LptA [Shewanella avicenniae]QSX34103.1 lipopolysaccharide transport periplasmic protein LptA [Shewanella avicenniae]
MRANNILLAIVLSASSLMATAADINLQQEVKIKSATQFADLKNKRVVYGGPVLVTQGLLTLKADELSATSPEKDQDRVLIATGKPATFTQKQEDGTLTTARANEIQFNINQRVLTLIGMAKVEQGSSMSSADKIIYDLNKQQLQAIGSDQEQVTTVIRPDNLPKEPTPPKTEQEQP